MFRPDEIYERLTTLGEDWADKDAAASLLEESRKILIAQLMLSSDEKSQSGKETFALSDPSYKIHVENMIESRKEANRAKVRYVSAQAWVDAKRTEAANERAANRNAV